MSMYKTFLCLLVAMPLLDSVMKEDLFFILINLSSYMIFKNEHHLSYFLIALRFLVLIIKQDNRY